MIHYTLVCSQTHEFDGWFASSAGFDDQAARGLVECPLCGDTKVTRGLMAPNLPTKSNSRAEPVPAASAPPPAPAPAAEPQNMAISGDRMPDQMRAALQRLRAEIERSSDYVGQDFAEQALRQHRGEAEQRAIYGEATEEQTEALLDEGVPVARIPWVSRSDS